MTGDMIPLDTLDPASLPMACQAQVVGALPAYVLVAEVVVQLVRRGRRVLALGPFALDLILASGGVARTPLVASGWEVREFGRDRPDRRWRTGGGEGVVGGSMGRVRL